MDPDGRVHVGQGDYVLARAWIKWMIYETEGGCDGLVLARVMESVAGTNWAGWDREGFNGVGGFLCPKDIVNCAPATLWETYMPLQIHCASYCR